MSAPAPHAHHTHASTLRWTLLLAVVDLLLWVDLAMLWDFVPRWVSLVGAYGALSLAAVVFLYARAVRGENPGPLLKGARSPWLQPLFLPFRAVAYLVMAAARVFRARDGGFSEVAPNVYVGARPFAMEHTHLARRGIAYVVDLCAELPTNDRMDRAPFERLGLPTLDRCPPTDEEIHRAVEWVAARHTVETGRAVLIHCAFGRGRSAMLAGAALVRLGLASDADDAIARMLRARPVRVKGAQRAALERYVRAHRSSVAP